jgi:hypothetical protein
VIRPSFKDRFLSRRRAKLALPSRFATFAIAGGQVETAKALAADPGAPGQREEQREVVRALLAAAPHLGAVVEERLARVVHAAAQAIVARLAELR